LPSLRKEAPIYYEYFCFSRNVLFSFWSAPSPLIHSSLSLAVLFFTGQFCVVAKEAMIHKKM
jgi:hypothetical protein